MTIGALSVYLDADEAARRRADRSFEQQGFAASFRHGWDAGFVQLWANAERGGAVEALQTERGVACSVGPLWYRGAFGTEALQRILSDAAAAGDDDDPGIDEGELRGNFALFVETARGRWLLNDALGFARIYLSADRRFFGTSWLAARAYASATELDEAAAVEYVLLGASHSERTPALGVTRLPLGFRLDLNARREESRFPEGLVPVPAPRYASFEDALDRIGAQLDTSFGEITAAFPGRTSAALSGGFDSRLIVAALLAKGERPRLFVYGPDRSDDVRIAHEIARGENIPLRWVDKAAISATLPECGVEDLARNALFFDGLPNDGIDDRGADRLTRLEQNAEGFIALNGGGGEIFRNFFHLPDRAYRPIDLVRAFYRGFDPAVFRSAGGLRAYERRLARSIARAAGLPEAGDPGQEPMTRERVELAYPFFRCHHWMGLNNSVSIRYGHFSTPLVDLELVRLAAALPMAWKNAGAFESRLIARRHAGVARHASSYGFAFVDGPDARARFSEWLTGARPVGLRPRIAAMGRWLRKDRVSLHKVATWRAKLPGEWRLDSMLDLDRLSADGAFERALSVEIVARELRP